MKLVRKDADELRCFVKSKHRGDSFPIADPGDEERARDRDIGFSSDDADDFDELGNFTSGARIQSILSLFSIGRST